MIRLSSSTWLRAMGVALCLVFIAGCCPDAKTYTRRYAAASGHVTRNLCEQLTSQNANLALQQAISDHQQDCTDYCREGDSDCRGTVSARVFEWNCFPNRGEAVEGITFPRSTPFIGHYNVERLTCVCSK